jgi:hypothetical protein
MIETGDTSNDLSDIVAAIGALLPMTHRAGIEPVIVGGVAMALWGVETRTSDLDLLARWSRQTLTTLRRDIEDAGGHWGPNLDVAGAGVPREVRIRIGGVRVDLIRAWEWRLQEAVSRARAHSWNGIDTRVARLEDVILLKLALGRPKDIKDVRRALRDHGSLFDSHRLEATSERWGLSADWHSTTRM